MLFSVPIMYVIFSEALSISQLDNLKMSQYGRLLYIFFWSMYRLGKLMYSFERKFSVFQARKTFHIIT